MREDNIRNDGMEIGFVVVNWGQDRGITFVETSWLIAKQ